MNCPACDRVMTGMGHGLYWCPRCGTVESPGGSSTVPALVGRCRQFWPHIRGDSPFPNVPANLPTVWRNLGIAESINRSEDRPT